MFTHDSLMGNKTRIAIALLFIPVVWGEDI